MPTTQHLLLDIIVLIVLVALSAFFSGSETALFSLSRARLLSYQEDKHRICQAIVKLMKTYQKTLIALIFWNNFVNVGISITSKNLMESVSAINPVLKTVLSIFISVVLLLVFGEITPKAYALVNAEKTSSKVAFPILYLRRLLAPIIWFTSIIFSRILDFLGRKKHAALNAEEYSSYLEMSASSGAFSEKELALLEAAFKLREIESGEIMIPRIDVISVKSETSIEDLTGIIKNEKREFYPVVKNDIDDTETILSARDFFLRRNSKSEWNTASCVFPATFIPLTTSLTRALNVMRTNNVPAALVVDEYGRTAGMLTIKDIYSSLTGDIEIVYDEPEYSIIQKEENVWIVDGLMPVFVFEDLTGVTIPEDYESNTINGLFSEEIGRMPILGDEIIIQGVNLRAEKLQRHRIQKLRIELVKHGESKAP
jgi:putative hemolysin